MPGHPVENSQSEKLSHILKAKEQNRKQDLLMSFFFIPTGNVETKSRRQQSGSAVTQSFLLPQRERQFKIAVDVLWKLGCSEFSRCRDTHFHINGLH